MTFSLSMLDWIQTIASVLVVVGLLLAYLQLRAALNASRGTVLLRMIEEWRSAEVYDSVAYIHNLRREWKLKEPDPHRWDSLAERWVAEHIGAGHGTDLYVEWTKRRIASQFISKMGYMVIRKYMSADDLFSVAPEIPRLLLVLSPIERAICEHFEASEPQVAGWDRPFDKLEFAAVAAAYDDWFRKDGIAHLRRRGRV